MDLHAAPPLRAGAPLDGADLALVLFHGRGGSAEGILGLGDALTADRPGVALLAPQASHHSWYPQRFLAPMSDNQPWLDAALALGDRLLQELNARGLPPERVALVGFSQGACLAGELAARHARRFAALLLYTGGLMGPTVDTARYRGDFAGTPVLLSSGDPDPHVPWDRVEDSAEVYRRLSAEVDLHRWPGRAHSVLEEEVAIGRRLLAAATGSPPPGSRSAP